MYHDGNGNLVITTLLSDALNEIEILKKVKHQNVVSLKEIIYDEKNDKIYLSKHFYHLTFF